MKKLKLVALSMLSLAFVACEQDPDPNDNNPKTNVASHEGKDRDIEHANVAFGSNIGGEYTLFLDLHDGTQANSWAGGTFLLSFGVSGSDSLVIAPGTYTYNVPQGGTNTFSFFELIIAEGGDTNTFMATGGTLEIEESAFEGNYKLSFDVDTQHDMHAGHTANLTGNYNGSTQYFSIKGIENE